MVESRRKGTSSLGKWLGLWWTILRDLFVAFPGWSILMAQLSWTLVSSVRDQTISVSWKTNKWELFFPGIYCHSPNGSWHHLQLCGGLMEESKWVSINLCKRVCSNCTTSTTRDNLNVLFSAMAEYCQDSEAQSFWVGCWLTAMWLSKIPGTRQ